MANDDALAEAQEVLRLQPGYLIIQPVLWWACSHKEMPREAAEFAKEFLRGCYGDDRSLETALDASPARAGYAEAMKRTADALAERFRTSVALPTDIASFYAEAHEGTKAVEWIAKGYEVRDPAMPCIGVGPLFDGIRDDPRFLELMRKMNLPTATGESR